ncbi:MAG: Uma2 family endonuclease [Planctomycetota bacterium]
MAEWFVDAGTDDVALEKLSARFRGMMRFERVSEGSIRVMAPESTDNSRDEQRLSGQIYVWNQASGEPGDLFGANGGWRLPDGSVLSPDVAWVRVDRYAALTDDQRTPFAQLVPDLVIEVLSPRDSRPEGIAKMRKWRTNGVRLGWLIDPVRHLAWVFRAGDDADPEPLENPDSLAGEDVLPGFTADLTRIWR